MQCAVGHIHIVEYGSNIVIRLYCHSRVVSPRLYGFLEKTQLFIFIACEIGLEEIHTVDWIAAFPVMPVGDVDFIHSEFRIADVGIHKPHQ